MSLRSPTRFFWAAQSEAGGKRRDDANLPKPITMKDILRELRFAAGHRGSNHISALYLALRDWDAHSPAAYRTAPELLRHIQRAKDTLDTDFPYGDSGKEMGSALEYYDSSPAGKPRGV